MEEDEKLVIMGRFVAELDATIEEQMLEKKAIRYAVVGAA